MDTISRATAYLARVENPSVALKAIAEGGLASALYETIAEWMEDFHASLDDEHEVGVRLVSFGREVVFHIEDMGYANPSLITFRGTSTEGNPVELIQHVSQISVLLVKLPRLDPSRPKKPLGFLDEMKEIDEGG